MLDQQGQVNVKEEEVRDRETLVFNAKLAEQAERYDEMVDCMKMVAEQNSELSVEERNLLSVAYKNVIGAKRASWRIIHSLEQKEIAKGGDSNKMKPIREYKQKVKKDIEIGCNDILDLINDRLLKTLPEAKDNPEAKVFFLKMKGDYYRYLGEVFLDEDKKDDYASLSNEAYCDATKEAKEKLATTHPIRLGLALNYSVFHYEIQNNPKEACKLAKEAFDNAIGDLDHVREEENSKDSTLIMQLLRDNLTLWTTDGDDDDVKVQEIDDAE